MIPSSRRGKRSASFPSLIALAIVKKENSKKTDGDEADGAIGIDLVSDGNVRGNILLSMYSTIFGSEARPVSLAADGTPQRLAATIKAPPRRRFSLSIVFFSLMLLLFLLGTMFGPFSSSRNPPRSSVPASNNRTQPDDLSLEILSKKEGNNRRSNSKKSYPLTLGLASDVEGARKRGKVLTQSGGSAQSHNPFTWLWGGGGGGGSADDLGENGGKQLGFEGVSRARRLRAAVVVCRHKLTECQETLRACEEKERGGGYKSSERRRGVRGRLRGAAKCDQRAKEACQSLATLCREANRSLKEQTGQQLPGSAVAEGEDEEEEEVDVLEDEGVADGPPDCTPFVTLDKQRRCVCPVLFKGRRRCVRRVWESTGDGALQPSLIPEPYLGDFLLSMNALKRLQRETGSSQLRVNLPEKEIPWRIVWEPGQEGSKENLLPSLLAQKDPVKRHVHRTCAVVGNSGIMLMERLGREIDSHSVVFRFNGAPTVGFESHVGSKTTFRLVNSKWYKFRETEEEMVIFQSRSASHFIKYIDFLISSEHLGEPTYLMAPQFTSWLANAAHNLSVLVRPPPPDTGGSNGEATQTEVPPMEFIPTSGWIGLMMAIQICRKVTLYGFQVSEAHGMPYHYHNQCSQPHGERDKIEWRLVKGLVEANLASFRNPCVLVCHRSKKECKRCMDKLISPSQLAQGLSLWASLPLPDYCLKQQQEAASSGEQNNVQIAIPDWMETGLPSG